MKEEQDTVFEGLFRVNFMDINVYIWESRKKSELRNSVVGISHLKNRK